MSWIQALNDTYDRIDELKPWELDDSIEPLLPIGHLFIKAFLTITISGEGVFLRATVENEGYLTPTPCTEDSSSRSGKKAAVSPHLLVDKLYYFAGDMKTYGTDNYISYIAHRELLSCWIEDNAPECIASLGVYLKQKTLINDLVSSKILGCDQKSLVWNKERLKTVPNTKPEETVVRWVVQDEALEDRLWKRETVAKSWLKHYLRQKNNEGYCQVSGEIMPIALNHPKNINPLAANAKIVSANDSSGFTYRGRFTASEHVNQIGFESSQKIHNTLRYLTSNHGYRKATNTLIFWSQKILNLPTPVANTENLFVSLDVMETDDLGLDIAVMMDKYLKGFNVGNHSGSELNKIFVMAMEAVTNGRMTITYFKEFDELDYITKLMKWHKECKWQLNYKKKKKDGKFAYHYYIGAPSVNEIIQMIYQRPKNSDGKSVTVSDSLYLGTRERLLQCILEGTKLPEDIVKRAVHQVSNRVRYHDYYEFDKSLNITCALINKNYYDRNGEEYDMALDESRITRDYLYGRLLAVAQNIESWAMKESGADYRMTNADRLMQRFSQRPFSTWKTIEMAIKPYQERLSQKGKGHQILLDEIMSLFNTDEFINDKPLSGEFLIGYHCQRQSILTKKSSSKEEV